MRTYLLAFAALLAGVGTGCSSIHSAQRGGFSAFAGGQRQQPRQAKQPHLLQQQPRQQAVAQAQYLVPQGEVQLAGHPGAMGACQGGNCPGYGPHGHLGHAHGRHFDGGFYGPFGGAHGTPGFPHGHHHYSREYIGPAGPPTAQVAYPYYTIRGPRDFLLDNPPSIGR